MKREWERKKIFKIYEKEKEKKRKKRKWKEEQIKKKRKEKSEEMRLTEMRIKKKKKKVIFYKGSINVYMFLSLLHSGGPDFEEDLIGQMLTCKQASNWATVDT